VNLCQLAERLPYGLYDLDAIAPPILARAGQPGESYPGIRKGEISLEGRSTLFDARGPFGNPSSDSDRTKTSEGTRRALVVVFGSPARPAEEWRALLERTAVRLLSFAEHRVTEQRVVQGEAA